jgi:hypothetical protein
MTGFERWVLTGIELGAATILDAAEGLDLNDPNTPRIIAGRLFKLWPPCKTATTRQPELALNIDPYVDQVAPLRDSDTHTFGLTTCARCRISGEHSRFKDTPYGPLCRRCLTLYLDRKWPENG